MVVLASTRLADGGAHVAGLLGDFAEVLDGPGADLDALLPEPVRLELRHGPRWTADQDRTNTGSLPSDPGGKRPGLIAAANLLDPGTGMPTFYYGGAEPVRGPIPAGGSGHGASATAE